MNLKYRENAVKVLCAEDLSRDLYGGGCLAKLMFEKEIKPDVFDRLNQIAMWFELPHPRGRDRTGEPDFAANKLIRILYLTEQKLPEKTVSLIRKFFQEYNFESKYKSENHVILFHSARYLYALKYPEDEFIQYGMNAEKMKKEERVFLHEFISFRMKRGTGEFDSLGYGAELFAALLNLHDFGETDMRRYSRMALNVLLLDMLADSSKEGYYGGAHGRIYERMALDFKNAPMCGLYEWYFGTGTHPFACIEAITSGFTPADYVLNVWKNRPESWENRECKHLHSITFDTPQRFAAQVKGNINKYTYVTSEFIMGAVNWQDDYPGKSEAAWYAHHQQHEWELTICKERSDLRIFTHHPGNGGPEGKEHGYWTGDLGCCCGQFFCEKNVVIAMYDIPEGKRQMIHARIPFGRLDAKIDGNFIWMEAFEVYAVLWMSNGVEAAGTDYPEDEIRSGGAKHGIMCMAGTRKQFGTMEIFKACVRKHPPVFLPAEMKMQFSSLAMTRDQRYINGEKVVFPYDTFDNPMFASKWGSGRIQTERVILDFEGWGSVSRRKTESGGNRQ